MINLTLSGLPLSWDGDKKKMLFQNPLQPVVPAVRRLEEMLDVLYRGEEDVKVGEDPGRELYYMYRDLYLPEDKDSFESWGIRYDITVLLPGEIGREYIKTAGHYHPTKPGSDATYPEVYEVLYGQAKYLLQKPYDLKNPRQGLEKVILVEATRGDKVLIPSGFGHVTINSSSDYLIMGNLVAREFSSLYEPMQQMGGAGYFCLSAGVNDETTQFIPNSSYAALPPLIQCSPADHHPFPLKKEISLYQSFLESPQDLSFLV